MKRREVVRTKPLWRRARNLGSQPSGLRIIRTLASPANPECMGDSPPVSSQLALASSVCLFVCGEATWPQEVGASMRGLPGSIPATSSRSARSPQQTGVETTGPFLRKDKRSFNLLASALGRRFA